MAAIKSRSVSGFVRTRAPAATTRVDAARSAAVRADDGVRACDRLAVFALSDTPRTSFEHRATEPSPSAAAVEHRVISRTRQPPRTMRARTSALLLVALAALASTARAADATPAADASAQRRRLQTIGHHNTHISSGTGTHVGDMVHRLRDAHEDNVQKIEDAARAAQASVQAAHNANMKEIADTTAKLTNAHDETRDRTLALMNSAEERFSAAMTAAIAALANAAEAWRDHLRESSARYKARVEAFQDKQVERLGKVAGVAAGVNAYGKQKVDEAYDAHRQRVADMVSEIGDHLGDTADKLTGGKGVAGRRFLEDHDDDDEEMDRRDRDWPNFRMNQEGLSSAFARDGPSLASTDGTAGRSTTSR